MDHLAIEVASGHLWLHILSIVATQNPPVPVRTLKSSDHTRHYGKWGEEYFCNTLVLRYIISRLFGPYGMVKGVASPTCFPAAHLAAIFLFQ